MGVLCSACVLTDPSKKIEYTIEKIFKWLLPAHVLGYAIVIDD